MDLDDNVFLGVCIWCCIWSCIWYCSEVFVVMFSPTPSWRLLGVNGADVQTWNTFAHKLGGNSWTQAKTSQVVAEREFVSSEEGGRGQQDREPICNNSCLRGRMVRA
ncbi:hypothetical protein BVRB_5g099930 [Beta vulgaris subsp. vulgaris]|nr:hypothetical protein BVRB_5g099930 [Beta vulgaris subsp. vulgaris]